MRCFQRARKQVNPQFTRCGGTRAHLRFARLLTLLLVLVCIAVWAEPMRSQDKGSEANAARGSGAEISVTVHDSAGEPISSPATVKLFLDGSIPSGQGATSRGSVVFVVTNLGEFRVVAEAPGYQSGQKDVSVAFPMRAQVDVYLQRDSDAVNNLGVPGRPVLAPKAKEAFDKGLRALSTDQLREAEKFVGEAVRLAPSHPDVLYVQGVLYLKQGNFAEAQNVLEKATQIDPNHARAFAALGMTLSDQGKYEAAITPLEKSLQLNATTDFETHWVAAKAYYQTGRYDDALKSSQSALLESKGKSPEIALLVAQALTAVGRYDDAAQTLREFLRQHGDRPEAAKAQRWLEGLRSSGKIARE
jgi:Flp pilus assembly protein TadD